LDLIYGYSSASSYPSLAITAQSINDSPGTLQNPLIIKTGSASANDGRYGDYFGASVDPSSPTKVWLAGEYQSSYFLFPIWKTYITSMTTTSITTQTTKSEYATGDTITISGKAAPVDQSKPILIEVLNSQNQLVRTDQVTISLDGTYLLSFTGGGPLMPKGIYQVKVTYNSVIAN